MEEENKTVTPAEQPEGALLAGKFKSVDALLRAYGELEAEFTRRSQRLKALEERAPAALQGETQAACGPRTFPEEQQAPVQAPVRGVPLMGAGGAGVSAPHKRPASIAEAGSLALGYFKRQRSQ